MYNTCNAALRSKLVSPDPVLNSSPCLDSTHPSPGSNPTHMHYKKLTQVIQWDINSKNVSILWMDVPKLGSGIV